MDRREFLGVTLAAALPGSLVAASPLPLPFIVRPSELLTQLDFRPGEMVTVPLTKDFKYVKTPRAYLTDGTVDYQFGTAYIGTKAHEVSGPSSLETVARWFDKMDAHAGVILLFAAKQNRFFRRRGRRSQGRCLSEYLKSNPLFCQVDDHLVAAHPLLKFVLAVRDRPQLMSVDRSITRQLKTEPFHMWGNYGMALLDGSLVACGEVTD